MADAAVSPRDDVVSAYTEAMAAEVDWGPLHFDSWGHYEQARPAMPSEAIEVIGRWPDPGYTLQYRPLLGELTQARQYPIDPFPEVTVLGRVNENDLPNLRSLAKQGELDQLSRAAEQVAKTDRTIPTEPPVPTGSIIPAHAEIPVHYVPAAGKWLETGRLVSDDHPSVAYAVVGKWGLRLGPPVGLTPTGLLVFQPLGMDDSRVCIEYPVSQPVGPRLTEVRVGLYRYDGLGGWHQAATLFEVDQIRSFMQPPMRSMSRHVPTILS